VNSGILDKNIHVEKKEHKSLKNPTTIYGSAYRQVRAYGTKGHFWAQNTEVMPEETDVKQEKLLV
jgi:hypothetical protein